MKFVLLKKDLLSKATVCVYQELIINEENFVLVTETEFLAIFQCLPDNYLQVLGYIEDDTTPVAFLFNIFQSINNGFFVINSNQIVLTDPLVIEVIQIGSLIRKRQLFLDDYIYCFKHKCLYKIRISNFIKYLAPYSKCGELTKRQIITSNSTEQDIEMKLKEIKELSKQLDKRIDLLKRISTQKRN